MQTPKVPKVGSLLHVKIVKPTIGFYMFAEPDYYTRNIGMIRNTETLMVIEVLPKNDCESTWVRIITHDGKIGWIMNSTTLELIA